MNLKKRTEQDLVNECLTWLKLHNCMVWRQNQGAVTINGAGPKRFVRFSHRKGISDIIGLLPDGRFLAVECKLPGKRKNLTTDQAQFIDEVNAMHGVAVCVTSVVELSEALNGFWVNGQGAA